MMSASLSGAKTRESVELFHSLFGLDVKAAKVAAFEPYSIARYVDEDGVTAAFLSCDLATACRLGAALTHIPSGRVSEAIAEKKIPDVLAENLSEVFNIGVSLVSPPDGRRIVLDRVVHGPESAQFESFAVEMSLRPQSAAAFEISRYGNCQLIFGVQHG
ncbi:MAG: hypothetical protein R3C49_10530 [Planctomycetaceae bacterium]